jgi:hypothetical protein
MIVIDASAMIDALVGREADNDLLDALQASVHAPRGELHVDTQLYGRVTDLPLLSQADFDRALAAHEAGECEQALDIYAALDSRPRLPGFPAPRAQEGEACEIVAPGGRRLNFQIDPGRRHQLLHGLDEIGLTLEDAAVIEAFQRRHRAARPWIWSSLG